MGLFFIGMVVVIVLVNLYLIITLIKKFDFGRFLLLLIILVMSGFMLQHNPFWTEFLFKKEITKYNGLKSELVKNDIIQFTPILKLRKDYLPREYSVDRIKYLKTFYSPDSTKVLISYVVKFNEYKVLHHYLAVGFLENGNWILYKEGCIGIYCKQVNQDCRDWIFNNILPELEEDYGHDPLQYEFWQSELFIQKPFEESLNKLLEIE